MKKPENKFLVLLFTIAACIALTFYVGFIKGEEIVYTHFFYIPVILAGMWYYKKAIYIALFLGIVHILVTHLSPHSVTIDNLARCAILTTVAYVIGFISKKRAKGEEELRGTRDYLDSLIHYANAPIIVWDPKFKITRFNRAFEHLTGYTADEVIGKELSILFPEADRDQLLSKIERTLNGEFCGSAEIPILHKDEDIRVALWNSANIHAGDGTTVIATIAQGVDITERKRAEEEVRLFSQAVDSSVDGVAMGSLKGKITYVNKAFVRMFGYSREELIGEEIAFIYPEDQIPKLEEALKATMEDGWTGELVGKRKDGELFPMAVSSSVVVDNEGKVIAHMANHRDITERKRAEEEIRKKNKELETFVYMVSHDLKSPVVSIQGFCSLLRKNHTKDLNEEALFYIERVQANATLMASLLEDLVELSRIGRIAEEKSEISVQEVVESVRAAMSRSLPSEEVEFILPENLPQVFYSEKRLYQIFYNLLSNAVKFKSENNPLRVEVGYQDNEDNHTLFVRDNGIGIEQKYHNKIFEPFSQLKEIESEGTGIGLTIVKKIVEKNQGEVWVQSQKGAGSTFYFTIPKKV